VQGTDTKSDFEQFLPEDFDAYLEEKWNSNMFTLPRRKVKDKLEAIGRILGNDLNQAGLSLIKNLSDEFPSLWNKKKVDTQWLFFSRDETAREKLTDLIDKERTLASTLADPTPRFRHIFLGMALNKDHLEIGLYLHHDAWVDRSNLINLLQEESKKSELIALLTHLPEHYEIVLGEALVASPTRFEETEINNLATGFDTEKGWLFMGARLPRDQVPVLGTEVVTTARQVFEFLVPLYRFFAWSPDNDGISLDTLVAQRNETLKARSEEFSREREARDAKQRQKEAEGLKLREEIAEKVRETQSWRQREMAARRAFAIRAANETKEEDARSRAEALAANWNLGGKKDVDKPPAESAPTDTKATPQKSREQKPREQKPWKDERRGYKPAPTRSRPSAPAPKPFTPSPSVSPERAANIQVGDLVQVTKGFLQGRRGVVQEIDEKGAPRISFGSLASRLSVEELSGLGPAPASQNRRSPRPDRNKKRTK
jgi:hypothetical protein